MSQLLSQLVLAGGLWTVIGTVVVALLYRSKTQAETTKMQNEAAKIADETFTHRMEVLKVELFDSLGISEERRRVMDKMDNAINVMKTRMQQHGNWDTEVTAKINRLCEELRAQDLTIDIQIGDPPNLNFNDIDFDFSIRRPSPMVVAEIAQSKGIPT